MTASGNTGRSTSPVLPVREKDNVEEGVKEEGRLCVICQDSCRVATSIVSHALRSCARKAWVTRGGARVVFGDLMRVCTGKCQF